MPDKQLPKDKDKQQPQDKNNKDNKPTAGNITEKGFENTTWEENTDHGAESTAPERKNTEKTLPGSSARDKQ
ncbi:MAG TPA: hypothetical protein VGD17_13320 [Chitinophagaceae bacterium]